MAGAAFVYGPDGARLKKVIGGLETLTLGDDYEVAPGGAVTKYLPGGAKRAGAETFWLHRDHLASVHVISDSAGAEVQRLSHFPYGDRRETATAHPESKGWIGQRQDETGLVYLHARYHDPAIARFVSADPSNPLAPRVGLNRYAYAGNDPINNKDPEGLFFESAWDAFNVGLGIASAISNVAAGNYLDAAVDIAGVAVDIGATLAPGVPGGAATGIRAARAAKLAEKVVDTTKVGKGAVDDAAQAAAGKADEAAEKAPIHGNPQQTTRNGVPTNHAQKSLEVAEEWAAQPEKYKSVHLNQKLRTATEGEIDSGIQPDVIGRRHDKKVDCCEILSPRQTDEQMRQKIEKNVPEKNRGDTTIVD